MTYKQRNVLLNYFNAKPYLERKEKHQLAKSLNISEKRISVWFCNQRQITRKDGLLCEGEQPSVKHGISNTIIF